MTITVRVPRPSSELLANLLGVVGLLGVAVAVGGLTGNWWWTLGVASAFAVFLSAVAATKADAAEDAPVATAPAAVGSAQSRAA